MSKTFSRIHLVMYLVFLFTAFSYSNSNITNVNSETHRLYLKIFKNNHTYNQILVAYNEQATNGYDFGLDSVMFNYNGTAIFSLIENLPNYYLIQGRALPFTDQDVVKLGIRIIQEGSFTIELESFTGLFTENQNVYLKDNLTQTTHNLKTGNYDFISEVGTFLDRFEIVYKEEPSIWTGTTWINGVPTSEKDAIIQGALSIDADYEQQFGSLQVNNLSLSETGSIVIKSDFTITVNGKITNNIPSDFVVENDANLIQNSNEDNIGFITVKRNALIKHLDYTIWSSPVLDQKLKAFSPQTLNNRIRIYDTTENTWKIVSNPENTNFTSGSGVMFRAPNIYSNSGLPYQWTGTFIGTPQNGEVRYNFEQNAYGAGIYQSVGNPYPSNIRVDLFKSENPTIGTLYFWTNTNAPSNGEYLTNNWATYTDLGGAVAENGQTQPNGIITVGQGFMMETNGISTEVVFDNQIRTNNTGVFFRTMNQERHRFWLDLSTENQGLNQILIGYMDGATNYFDFGIDGKMFNYSGSAIYSLIEQSDDKFVIQGRALPFDNNDTVRLGFRATQAGNYSLTLSNFDGLFLEGQEIFIKDNLTQTTHNLNTEHFNFVSEEGTFDTRFEIVYQQTSMSVSDPELNNKWIVYSKDNSVVIQTQELDLNQVMVYDLLGRLVYQSKAEANHHTIADVDSNQILIVKIFTTDNKALHKKINH